MIARIERTHWRARGNWLRFKDWIRPPISNLLSWLHLLRKPFWRLPEVPPCEWCGNDAEPYYIHTGDSWAWGWECEDCGPDDMIDENPRIDWPFVVNWAGSGDWDRLGFRAE